jgi:hypothetical protein
MKYYFNTVTSSFSASSFCQQMDGSRFRSAGPKGMAAIRLPLVAPPLAELLAGPTVRQAPRFWANRLAWSG